MFVFAQWLDITMSNKKIKGRDLAKAIGVHDSAISKYRSGQSTPSMKVCTRLAKALDVDPLRLAATIGLIDAEEFGVEPLPTPPPIAHREAAKKRIDSLPGLTKASKQELLEVYDEMLARNSHAHADATDGKET